MSLEIDTATALLLSQLILSTEIDGTAGSSDEEYALRLQGEDLLSYLSLLDEAQFAQILAYSSTDDEGPPRLVDDEAANDSEPEDHGEDARPRSTGAHDSLQLDFSHIFDDDLVDPFQLVSVIPDFSRLATNSQSSSSGHTIYPDSPRTAPISEDSDDERSELDIYEDEPEVPAQKSGDHEEASENTSMYWTAEQPPSQPRTPLITILTEEEPEEPQYEECLVCADIITASSRSYRAPCGHLFCPPCLVDFSRAMISSEALWPPKCCDMNLDAEFQQHIDSDLAEELSRKNIEYNVRPQDRVYCANPRCSMFIGGQERLTKPHAECENCYTRVCISCRDIEHPGQPCQDHLGEAEFMEIAQANGWQRCLSCTAMVELTGGCPHVVCRCRSEFCYRCGAAWRNHVCTV
ncbi:hypothetical protein C8J56DRAFT_857347 [Mycena floridula]|nr:hypothetical protein C8J56DRAFT_857347 [Mycena floridula]